MLSLLALSLGLSEEIAIPASAGRLAYRIDRTEVSIEAFESFENNGGYTNESLWSAAGKAWLASNPGGAGRELRRSDRPPNHPVVAVSYFEAEAYCRWRGGSLPGVRKDQCISSSNLIHGPSVSHIRGHTGVTFIHRSQLGKWSIANT